MPAKVMNIAERFKHLTIQRPWYRSGGRADRWGRPRRRERESQYGASKRRSLTQRPRPYGGVVYRVGRYYG